MPGDQKAMIAKQSRCGSEVLMGEKNFAMISVQMKTNDVKLDELS